MQCALTCYSIVAEGDPENQLHNDRNSINLGGQQSFSHIGVVYPANLDAVRTREFLQKEIQKPEDDGSNQQVLQILDGLEAAGPIGQIRYASGLRRDRDGRRMDWAMVVSPGTYARNKPPLSIFFDPRSLQNGRVNYWTDPTDFITTFGTLKRGD